MRIHYEVYNDSGIVYTGTDDDHAIAEYCRATMHGNNARLYDNGTLLALRYAGEEIIPFHGIAMAINEFRESNTAG